MIKIFSIILILIISIALPSCQKNKVEKLDDSNIDTPESLYKWDQITQLQTAVCN